MTTDVEGQDIDWPVVVHAGDMEDLYCFKDKILSEAFPLGGRKICSVGIVTSCDLNLRSCLGTR